MREFARWSRAKQQATVKEKHSQDTLGDTVLDAVDSGDDSATDTETDALAQQRVASAAAAASTTDAADNVLTTPGTSTTGEEIADVKPTTAVKAEPTTAQDANPKRRNSPSCTEHAAATAVKRESSAARHDHVLDSSDVMLESPAVTAVTARMDERRVSQFD